MKKYLTALTALVLALSLIFGITAFADGNIRYASGITDEMCQPSYWYNKGIENPDKLLMTTDDIRAVNQAAIDGKGTNVFDLYDMAETYNADSKKASLADIEGEIPTRDLFVNGVKIPDNREYFLEMINAITSTGYTGTQPTQYAVCSERADLVAYPTPDKVGYFAEDTDDEFENAGLCINEPFVIMQKCDIRGETFYWGYSWNCTGWINAKSLAICENKAQWLDAVKVDLNGKDFIVVIQDKIITEIAIDIPYASEVNLTFGTILKLIPENEIPEFIGERNAWNNYFVYLPVRNENGMYEKKPGLISQHCNVSVGFLPYTEKNLLDVAFNCLGNRYGWAGNWDSMDCSLYTRNIYRCFGFEFPRNTTWQQKVPDTLIDLSTMTDEEKARFIETLPIGTLLFISGHTMMYIGSENGESYAISSSAKVIDSEGDLTIRPVYSVIINSLSTRRTNGLSWLHNIISAVIVTPPVSLDDCSVTVIKDIYGTPVVAVSYNSNGLYEGINYTVEYSENSVTVTGINNFNGSVTVEYKSVLNIFQRIAEFFRNIFSYIISLFIKA